MSVCACVCRVGSGVLEFLPSGLNSLQRELTVAGDFAQTHRNALTQRSFISHVAIKELELL